MHCKQRIRTARSLLLLTVVIMSGGLFAFKQVSAQDAVGKVEVTSINSDSFPSMGVAFEVHDPLGGFVTDLKAENVQIHEDGETRPVSSLELLKPGAQFTIAFNLSPELSNRFAGTTRMENILARLGVWAGSQGASTSDLVSLATNTGLQLIRSDSPQEWKTALNDLAAIDLLGEQSNLNALTRAVDLATDASTDGAMKQAVLYVTPLPNASTLKALPNLAERAASQGVSIFVWLVGSTSSASSSPELYTAVENLATSTGGSLFLYSGQEALPDPDGYLNPLRYSYRAFYDSEIQASGSYDISVEIQRGDLEWVSQSRPVFMNVLAPNPIFLSPPSMIERSWREASETGEATLQPEIVDIQIVVEFSDGHQRPLRASRLFVDAELAVENTREPFDVFQWDIRSIDTTSRHVLSVEVEDTLGLTRRSIDMPVDITVEPANGESLKTILSGQNLLIFGGILAAGAVLVLALGLLGRKAQRQGAASRRTYQDPLTQPVPQHRDSRKGSAAQQGSNRPTWPRYAISSLSSAPAWLLRVPDTGGMAGTTSGSRISPSSNPASAIPLSRRETRLGSDEKAVNYKLSSATVSSLHARITQTAGGGFLIQDAGSVAGTWVNYAPVPAKGVLLQHGDLVQIGKVAFRFELANPPEERQPHVSDRQENP